MVKLYVFEGADGVGKTSLIQEIEKRLLSDNIICNYFSFPGREAGTLGNHVYKLHHDPGSFEINELSPLSLQMLHVAAHVDALEQRIFPLLQTGAIILLDRYWWSTWVYGVAAAVPRSQLEAIIAIESLVWQGVVPTTLFLINRNGDAAIPVIQDAYQELVKKEYSRYPIVQIQNDGTIDVIASKVIEYIIQTS